MRGSDLCWQPSILILQFRHDPPVHIRKKVHLLGLSELCSRVWRCLNSAASHQCILAVELYSLVKHMGAQCSRQCAVQIITLLLRLGPPAVLA